MEIYWNTEKEDKLIKYWQGAPCLYDVSLKSYSNRYQRQLSLEEIASKINLTSEIVAKHMQSLRTQYARLCKPFETSSEAKQITGRQKWILEKLHFLKAHIRKKTRYNMTALGNLVPAWQIGLNDEEIDLNSISENQTAVANDSSIEIASETSGGSCTPKPWLCQSSQAPSKRKQTSSDEDEVATSQSFIIDETTPEPASKIFCRDDTGDDEDAIFGCYIVSELRKIKHVESKLILKNTITNAIFNTRMGTMHAGKNNPTRSTQEINSWGRFQDDGQDESWFAPERSNNYSQDGSRPERSQNVKTVNLSDSTCVEVKKECL